MFRRIVSALLCLLMLCAAPALKSLVAPSSQAPDPAKVETRLPYKPRVFINFSLVRRLYCGTPGLKNWGRGTAVVISENTLMTAAHVVVGTTCFDEATGARVSTFYRDDLHDIAFASIEGGTYTRWFKLSCEGYRGGREYSAIGYQFGRDLVETRLTATFAFTSDTSTTNQDDGQVRAPHLRLLEGDIYKGMSGGPIVDEDGVVVGLNTATDHNGVGFSRELRDTILCNSKHDDQAPSSSEASTRTK